MVQMKLFGGVVFALCLFSTLASSKSTKFDFCDKKADYAVKVAGLNIDPFPITRNKVTSFQIAASTEKEISGGKLQIAVSYFGFHIHDEDHELCKETTCPVCPGNFVVSHSQALPGITPPGNYNLRMKLVDNSNKELTCISFDFSLGFFSEEASLADA